jgi:hypothetical protein
MIRNYTKLTTIAVSNQDKQYMEENITGKNNAQRQANLIDYWERTHGKTFWEQSIRQLVDKRYNEREAENGR